MKTIKRIAAFVLAISFCFVLMLSPGANAQGAITGQQFGAWIASALVSLNCIGQIIGGNFQSGIEAFRQLQHNIGVPTIQETLDSLPEPYDVYTFNDAAVSEALNTSTIKIRKGVTTIDGVEYDELWVSPEGAQKLKTNAFDFITKYNLVSNDTSTLMRGYGMLDGVPMFTNQQGIHVSQSITFDIDGSVKKIGNITLTIGNRGQSSRLTFSNGVTSSSQNFWHNNSNGSISFSGANGGSISYKLVSGSNFANGSASGVPYDTNGFQYDFISGTIPAEDSIPDDYGLSVKIPHDKLETFYNAYPQYNVDNSTINIQQDQIDIDELTQAIFDKIESVQDIKGEWTDGEVEPEPEPPAPVEDVIEGLNVIANQQFEQMQQQTQIQQQQQQTQQQQLQEQQQISQNTSEINDTIKDVTATPDADQLPSFKFDLRELFPFCIPFDIYRLLSSFDAEPQAPHVQLPIVIDSINFRYNLDLDFSAWDPVAQAMRTAELIVYAIGLAWATGKVIKW